MRWQYGHGYFIIEDEIIEHRRSEHECVQQHHQLDLQGWVYIWLAGELHNLQQSLTTLAVIEVEVGDESASIE